MRLLWNWRRVLKYSWSIRLGILAGLLSGAEVALPLIQDLLPVDRGTFALLSFAATAGALIARVVMQQTLSGGDDG